jgi:membrane protease YdiL (CAAX protease family)
MVYSLAANEALAYFYPASQDWITIPQGWVSTVLFFVVATLAAPLTEELVFRGWLYTALRAKLPFAPCVVIVSALFALAHWESTHLYALAVFPVGLALGYLREKTGSLKTSMSFHAFYNGFAFVLMFFGK